MNRRDLLRAGLITGAALILPDEQFVRRFFPVGIDLRKPPRVEGWLTAQAVSAQAIARALKHFVVFPLPLPG